MAHHWSEGVSSLRFTAREFQLELVEEALKHNLLTCPPATTGFFVTLKLIQELAYQIRRFVYFLRLYEQFLLDKIINDDYVVRRRRKPSYWCHCIK